MGELLSHWPAPHNGGTVRLQLETRCQLRSIRPGGARPVAPPGGHHRVMASVLCRGSACRFVLRSIRFVLIRAVSIRVVPIRPGTVPGRSRDVPGPVSRRPRSSYGTVPGAPRDHPVILTGLSPHRPETARGRSRDRPGIVTESSWDFPGTIPAASKGTPFRGPAATRRHAVSS